MSFKEGEKKYHVWSGKRCAPQVDIDLKPSERKYLRFMVICPECGKKSSYYVGYAATFNDRETACGTNCQNFTCKCDLKAIAYKGLLSYLDELKAKKPLLADKIRGLCGKIDLPSE